MSELLCVLYIQALESFFFVHVFTDDTRNRNQLLHNFVKCVRDEYLDHPEKNWLPILQHKYIMQRHLEVFLRIEVRDLYTGTQI